MYVDGVRDRRRFGRFANPRSVDGKLRGARYSVRPERSQHRRSAWRRQADAADALPLVRGT
jgi:hypothetical protein